MCPDSYLSEEERGKTHPNRLCERSVCLGSSFIDLFPLLLYWICRNCGLVLLYSHFCIMTFWIEATVIFKRLWKSFRRRYNHILLTMVKIASLPTALQWQYIWVGSPVENTFELLQGSVPGLSPYCISHWGWRHSYIIKPYGKVVHNEAEGFSSLPF